MPPHSSLSGIVPFIVTAQSGSFTEAARRLEVTKSAVGKAIARLELRLGVRLFNRSTRSLRLTVEGEAYLASCLRAVGEMDEAEAALTSQRTRPAGRLRLDVPTAFGRRLLLAPMLRLAHENPDLRLAMTFSDRRSDPIEDGIDLLVRLGPVPDSLELVARHLTTQKLRVCAAPSYLAAHGAPMTLEALAERAHVTTYRSDHAVAWPMKLADGSVHAFLPSRTYEMGDGDAMLAATVAGCGLAQLPTWLAGEALASGALVSVLDQHAGVEIPVSAIWPRTKQLLPKVRRVVDELVALAEAGALG